MRFAIYVITAFMLLNLFVYYYAHAAEPAFCSIEYFEARRLKVDLPGVEKLKVFQLGKLKFVNAAIGGSDAIELAKYSTSRDEQYCTWYYNSGNEDAETLFRHVHMTGPYKANIKWIWSDKLIADRYERKLNPELPDMLQCIEEGYLAGGCNGDNHRGPTVDVWFLGVAGCTPKTSVKIVEHFFGKNHVKTSTREAVAERGYITGNNIPEYRTRIQAMIIER